jgi:hypothetical protein
MVLQVQVSGTKTTDGTEQTLGTSTYVGVHVVQIDLSAMQAGDTLRLKVKTKTLTSGTTNDFIVRHSVVYRQSQSSNQSQSLHRSRSQLR